MTITIEPKKIVQHLGVVVLFLALANIAGVISTYILGHPHVFGLVRLFNLDGENNIPAYYSSLSLFFSCALAAIIGRARRKKGEKDSIHWLVLAGLFLFLSVDELAALHEKLIPPLRSMLHTSGIFYFAWVMPYLVLALGVGAAYLRFLFRLPAQLRNWMVFSGIVYVSGALGLEMLGGWYRSANGDNMDLTYAIMTTIEETLEMIGVLLFIYTLLTYVASELSDLKVAVTASGQEKAAVSPARPEVYSPTE